MRTALMTPVNQRSWRNDREDPALPMRTVADADMLPLFVSFFTAPARVVPCVT